MKQEPDHLPEPSLQPGPTIDSFSGILLILFAKGLGYVVLGLCAFVIMQRPPWHLSLADILFGSCAVAIPLAQQRVSSKYDAPVVDRAPISMMRRVGTHLGAAAVLWLGVQSVQLLA